jgi:hypothetical protein
MYVRTSTYDQKKLFANNIGPFLAGKFMPQKDREKAISGHATFKLDSNLKAPPPSRKWSPSPRILFMRST